MKKIGFIAGLSFFAGAVFFALSFGYLQKSPRDTTVLSPSVAQAETIQVNGLNFAPLVKRVRPAVVKVVSESIRERRRSLFGDEFFDRFFNTPGGRERVSGIGSGFIISPDGYIITNHHVVRNAVSIKIITIDKQELTAKNIGSDPKTDLALLKVNQKNLPFIELGDSDKAEIGEWVLAIGNPFYQDLSVTAGIISAKGRQLVGTNEVYEDFIQTDAAINQGNSGGPLINMNGQVIGINSAIIAPAGGNVGIGFAIPSSMAKKVIDDLKKEGRVIRGWVGISIIEMSESEAEDWGLSQKGVLILKVESSSPAEKAGLKRNDVITKLNGEKIISSNKLRTQIANLSPKDKIDLTVVRDKKELDVTIIVGEAPDTVRYQTDEGTPRSISLGMVLTENNRSVAREYDLTTTKGLVVTRIERNSSASQAGIRPGDVILEVNRREISTVAEFRQIIGAARPGSRLLLYINRYGEEDYIRLELPE